MSKTYIGEIWKEVKFSVDNATKLKIEISNFGRVRSFSQAKQGNILNGSLVGGYKVIRLKLYSERDEKSQKRLDYMRAQIAMLVRQVGKLRTKYQVKRVKDKAYTDLGKKIKQQDDLLEVVKKKYQIEFRKIENARANCVAYLVHRLVAEYFIKRPSPHHTIVGHLDFNKENNHYTNLKWFTHKEHVIHREKSPLVIQARRNRIGKHFENSTVYKLNTSKVKLIKRRMNEGVSLRALAKTFKVSETQMLRIKRGENWAHVDAANE